MKQRNNLIPWITAIILLAVSLSVGAQNVSFNNERLTLKQAFEKIESVSNYKIAYNASQLDVNKQVVLNQKNKTVTQVIEDLLSDTGCTYELKGTQIVIVPKRINNTASSKITIKGKVVDESGEGVIGASILEKGTSNGVITDFDGNFTISADAKSTLVFSYIGFQSVEKMASPNMSITLFEDKQVLDEVVVVGYGVQKKRDVSTAISQIKADDIADLPSADIRQSMAGKMPGVQVMQTSGDPEGNNLIVRVRGVSSATAGNDPLYIIDGVPMENGLSNINANDVESIEVLKDASSAAIYGSRGSNGVVIITTKKGTSDKVKVGYDGYYGWDKVSRKLPMMNAYQFAQISKEAHDNAYYDLHPGGNDPNGSRPESYSNYPMELYPYLTGEEGLTDTDWQDEIFRGGYTTSHNISIQGKSDAVNYFISANYYDKNGIIIESDYQKYSFRMNLDGKYKRFNYGINVSPSYSVSNRVNASGSYGNEGIVQSALAYCPIWPVYDADGSFNYQGNGFWRIGNDYQHNEILNPVALAKLQSDRVERMTLVGRLYAGFDFGKGFSFQTSFGGNYYGAQNDTYRESSLPLLGKAYYDTPSNPVGESSHGSYYNWLWENQLNYNATFGEHTINAVLVQSAQNETYRGVDVKATDYPNDYIQTIDGGTVTQGSSKKTQWSLASYLARVQYSYMGRYMLSAAIRADGSSRFGKNNRWGYFPSASVAWRFSDERFIKEKKAFSWIDDAKIRFSYGQTGNFDIGNYEHLATMGTEDYVLGEGSGSRANGYKPNGVENPDLTWEKTSMMNIGLDLLAFGGYFGATIEYYNSITTDMLLNVPIPRLTGYQTTRMNIGEVKNNGWEITLTSQHSYKNGLKYSFNATYSRNVNEVKALGANDTPIISSGSVAHAYYITKVGERIGSYYLLIQDGIFKNEDELKAYPHVSNAKVGDFRFIDVDGDGVIDLDKDRTIVGNYMPDFTYGFGGTLGYKGIDLSFNFQGVYGNEILNLNRRYLDNMEGNVNGTTIGLNRYVDPNNIGNGKINRANRKTTGNNSRTSTWHLEDGSYLRLQNITLGYTFPKKWINKLHLDKLRIYVSANNLKTWTNYTGYNPEVSLRNSDALTPGEDYGTYPLSKTFMVGLNITTF
ncbi:MAG: TonB-dependent receptor [Prevotella sp.]|nr:TonB-dependent receptor [Prevotella sp.]